MVVIPKYNILMQSDHNLLCPLKLLIPFYIPNNKF